MHCNKGPIVSDSVSKLGVWVGHVEKYGKKWRAVVVVALWEKR